MDPVFDIIVEGLQKRYVDKTNEVLVLNNMNFKVERSKIFCIVGPSGCGKSTLLKILLNLIPLDAGNIRLHPERQNRVAYIQQNTTLLPWRTLLQNASLGAEIRDELDKAALNRLMDTIREFGLEGFEHCLPNELSGGMRQRVNIISALESRPSILLCDEPFSSIDFVTRLDLSTIFKKRCSFGKMTTIFVTHNIEEAIFLGDEVAVMSGRPGHIVSIYEPNLTKNKFDAIACRENDEFQYLFKRIWLDLKANYES